MSDCSVPIIPVISRSATPRGSLVCCEGSRPIAGLWRTFAARSRAARRCSDRDARSRRGGGCWLNSRRNPDRRFRAACRHHVADDRDTVTAEAETARLGLLFWLTGSLTRPGTGGADEHLPSTA